MTVEAHPGRLARLRPVSSIWDARRRERLLDHELDRARSDFERVRALVRDVERESR